MGAPTCRRLSTSASYPGANRAATPAPRYASRSAPVLGRSNMKTTANEGLYRSSIAWSFPVLVWATCSGVRQNSGAGSEISIKMQFCIYGSIYWPKIIAVRRQEGVVDHSNSHVGWAKAPEDWTHSRTLARDRRRVGEGFVAGFRTAAGCQPAIQPITTRRYLAGAGGFLKFVSHPNETGVSCPRAANRPERGVHAASIVSPGVHPGHR